MQTLAASRRNPAQVALVVVTVALFAATVLLAVFWPTDKVIRIDLVDTTPTTAPRTVSGVSIDTRAASRSTVGLIPAACATVDPVAFPCPAGTELVVVSR